MNADLGDSAKAPSIEDIQRIVEEGVDDEIPDFDMGVNIYEEYGMDSLGAVAMVVFTQKNFRVRLPDDKMPEIQTGNQLLAAIVEMQRLAQDVSEATAE